MVNTRINPKQAKLLQTAKRLFWKFGIKRVTIAEICREAQVSKMTFYKFYANKAKIAKAILSALTEKSMKKYRNIMQEDIAFSEKVKKVIQLKLENTTDISQELIKDIYDNKNLELSQLLEKKRQEHFQWVLNDFKKAAEEGHIRKNIKPQFILYFLNKLNEMMMDKHLLTFYKNEQELIMELTNFFFYGLGVAYSNEENS